MTPSTSSPHHRSRERRTQETPYKANGDDPTSTYLAGGARDQGGEAIRVRGPPCTSCGSHGDVGEANHGRLHGIISGQRGNASSFALHLQSYPAPRVVSTKRKCFSCSNPPSDVRQLGTRNAAGGPCCHSPCQEWWGAEWGGHDHTGRCGYVHWCAKRTGAGSMATRPCDTSSSNANWKRRVLIVSSERSRTSQVPIA